MIYASHLSPLCFCCSTDHQHLKRPGPKGRFLDRDAAQRRSISLSSRPPHAMGPRTQGPLSSRWRQEYEPGAYEAGNIFHSPPASLSTVWKLLLRRSLTLFPQLAQLLLSVDTSSRSPRWRQGCGLVMCTFGFLLAGLEISVNANACCPFAGPC
ncbi:hypothetical protein AAFF_G00267760 [Aldrovandia affinis]|uniref:Uncharacterized protein n=1 Tax=Aldrovandia affinis TaxID=143900 RepID=A0AAD7SRX8_9TELE|nr:hypothetical protein AAFF_G00267760 [Aldrovandia affinis]